MLDKQIQASELETRLIIRKYVKPGATVLDAGVGLGELIKGLAEFECHGVDISIPYLKKAKSSGLKVTMAKLENLPFSDQYFDAVVACDVLEHVLGLDAAMEQLLRVLEPGGMLIVRVPNVECLDSYLTEDQPYSHSHVRSFSLTSLRLYIEKCFGLKFVDHKYCGYLFNSFPQIKYQSPSFNSKLRKTVSELLLENPNLVDISEFKTVSKLLELSIEEMTDALIVISKSYPEVFESLSSELINPLELIAVFQKQY
jgi:ubiquinone/menaquinone biosynthesis C-methylase UbiE